MSASKFAPKASTVQAKAPRAKRTVHAEPITDEAVATTTWRDSFAELGIKVPTDTRVLISMVVGFVTSFTTSYYGCSVAVWLANAALVYSGSAFLSLLVLVLGCIVAMVGAFRIGMAAGKFVLGFDMADVKSTAEAVTDAARSKVSVISGWFKRSEPVSAAA